LNYLFQVMQVSEERKEKVKAWLHPMQKEQGASGGGQDGKENSTGASAGDGISGRLMLVGHDCDMEALQDAQVYQQTRARLCQTLGSFW
jgi:hypothetical protein